jgi:isoquinoline 1-oxidoreductase subunit beta
MNRRTLLGSGGALTVLFATGCEFPVFPDRPAPTPDGALSWIRHADGRYSLFLPRAEMGQNISTALKQIACDELGIGWEMLTVEYPSTSDIEPVRATVGSDSIKDFAVPLAQACATLRDALAAGRQTGRLTVRPRPPAELRLFGGPHVHVGRSGKVEQAVDIVRGAATYAADIRRPGIVYGRVLHAPASPDIESRLLRIDEAAARGMPGFVALVRSDVLTQGRSHGLGIVASTPGALDRIEEALDPRWTIDGRFEQTDIDSAIDVDAKLARGGLGHTVAGDAIDRKSRWDVDLRIDVPLAAHAAIEPRAAVAEIGPDGKLHLWTGSQDPFYQRNVIARRLALPSERVVVHNRRIGGAYGGKTICTVELEAAVLARAVGRPVKVQWTRSQEFRQGFHRPPSSHRIRASLENGNLDQWWHAFVSSHIIFTNAAVPAWLQTFTDLIGDAGVARGAGIPYRAARRRTEFDLVRLPVLTGPWRGLGAGPNGLAVESAIDECARVAGVDPLVFRLRHIEDSRLARVLRRVAEISGWRNAGKLGPRRGRGLACGIYKGMSYAAVVADVEVSADGSDMRVMRLWCAHDCGRVVNPDQVRAQCEGNLVWGVGMVLTDNLPVANSCIEAMTLADAPIPTLAEIPPMEIALVDEGEPPTGAGETVIVAAAGAIANAARAASGMRPTRFPLAAHPLRPGPT